MLKTCRLIIAIAVLTSVTPARALTSDTITPSVTLQNTRGGWLDSSRERALDDYAAAYPKPPVDRGAQRGRQMIAGQLKVLKGQRTPYRLIVNGNAMPLYADEQGEFARPYAFGRGSNSVEIRSPDGTPLKRIQFYDTNAVKTQAKLRAILTWNDAKAEVDLHVVTPDGQHAFWARPLLRNGGGLDVDSVDGAGPEIFSTASPLRGSYLMYVNYWGNFDAAGYNFAAGSNERPLITVQLDIISHENTVDEKRESFTVPLRKIGDLVFVKMVRF